jgi:HlyD family secretion protein
MDVPRGKSSVRKRRVRVALYAVIAIVAVTAITLGVARMKPAAPGVERATVLTDTVKRGQMLRQVRGIGTLVPQDIRVIAAATQGRVERVFVQPARKSRQDGLDRTEQPGVAAGHG